MFVGSSFFSSIRTDINEFMRYAENPVLKLCCGFCCRLRCLSSGQRAGVVYYVTTCPHLVLCRLCIQTQFVFIAPLLLPLHLLKTFLSFPLFQQLPSCLPSPCSQGWLANDGLAAAQNGGSEQNE